MQSIPLGCKTPKLLIELLKKQIEVQKQWLTHPCL